MTTEPPGAASTDAEPRVRRRADALWRRALSTVVVLPAGAEEPLTLAGTGPALWELLAEPRTLSSLVNTLSAAYDVEPEVVEADIAPIVELLVAAQALEAV